MRQCPEIKSKDHEEEEEEEEEVRAWWSAGATG
jgi:hypothetical protein